MNAVSRSISILCGAALIALSTTGTDALAKKKKGDKGDKGDAAPAKIEATGVSAIDDVFTPAQAILDSLNGATESLNSVNANIVKAMGLGADESVADAIAMMKEKAAGKFKVEIKDMKPAVSVAEDAGDDVKAAVAAINDGGKAMVDAIKTLKGIPDQAKEIVAAAKAVPGKAPAAFKEAGLSVKEMGGALKTVKNNVKAVGGIPGAAKGTLDAAKGNIELIKGLGAK
jgi:hypothetical protein